VLIYDCAVYDGNY